MCIRDRYSLRVAAPPREPIGAESLPEGSTEQPYSQPSERQAIADAAQRLQRVCPPDRGETFAMRADVVRQRMLGFDASALAAWPGALGERLASHRMSIV